MTTREICVDQDLMGANIEVSGTTGVGIQEWTDWVVSRQPAPSPA